MAIMSCAASKPSFVPSPAKTAWEYPYDLAQIYVDCKAYAESIGMDYATDLDINNSHWTTPRSTVFYQTTNATRVKEIYGK